jgi:hypothetical protein
MLSHKPTFILFKMKKLDSCLKVETVDNLWQVMNQARYQGFSNLVTLQSPSPQTSLLKIMAKDKATPVTGRRGT